MPIHLAAGSGEVDMVQLLLARQAFDVGELVTITGQTALHVAVESRKKLVVELLSDPKIIARLDKSGLTAVHIAASRPYSDYGEILGLLLGKVTDKDQRTGTSAKLTALHLAVINGHSSTVWLLLGNGAAIEAVTANHDTVLHLAAQNGHAEIVQFLITKDVDVSAKNKAKVTALHFAAQGGYTDIAGDLLDSRAPIDGKDKDGWTALIYGVSEDKEGVVSLLLDRGARVDVEIEDEGQAGVTALHMAANQGNRTITVLLIDHNAEPNSKGKDGWTPLMSAARSGRDEMVELLISKGADTKLATVKNQTALHIASRCSNQSASYRIVKMLLENGADPTVTYSRFGRKLTAQKFAIRNGNVEAAQLLELAENQWGQPKV